MSSNLLDTCQKESAEKIGQKRLGHKLGVSRMTICRQLSKMNISCSKREKKNNKIQRESGGESKEFVQKIILSGLI